MTFHVRRGGVPAAILALARAWHVTARRMILAGVVSCS